MRKQFYGLLILLSGILFPSLSFSQDWYNYMTDENMNYYEAVKKIEAYFENRDKGKGSGYKQFKRWEYLMSFHIDSAGNRIKPEDEYKSYVEFVKKSATSHQAKITANNWVELGPHSWTRTSSWSPGLGRIMSIAIDPSDNNVIYIGTPGGGCWKTTNGGSTWAVLTDNFSSLEVPAVTIDPNNSNTVYIGCSANRLMKSNDGGASWNNANSGIGGTVRRIIVHPTNSNIVIAATSTGVYRSTNGGTSWTQSRTGNFNDAEFKPGDPSIVYACGTSFYRSADNGVSFTQIISGISASGRSFISVTPANSNYVYMVMANGNEFGYLFRSTDSGLNFTTRVTGNAASGTNYFGYSPNGTDPGGQASYDMAMCVSPANAEEVHIGGIITWKSTNGGTSFVSTTEWSYPNSRGYTHCDMHALEYVNGVIYSGSDGGIFKSTDGGDNWTNISAGLGIRQFYRIGCSRTNSVLVSGGSQDNGTSIRRTTDLVSGWIDWLGADGMETFFDHTNPNIVYGTSQYGTLYKSTNGGNTRFNLPTPETDGAWVTPFAIDPNVATTLYVGYVNLHKSTNGGNSWTQLTNLTGSTDFTQLDIAPSNSNYIYASKGGTIYKTTDGGANWTTVTIPSGNVNYISVHPANPNKVVVAATSSRIYITSNGGTTWTDYKGSLPNVSYNCAVYYNNTDDGIYLGTSTGVYYRDNTLSDWVLYSNSLPRVDVRELEIHYASGKLRAGTYGRGLWETDLYGALPVYYTAFNVDNSADLKSVLVSWVTSTEINNDYFEIQRSHNAMDFYTIGTVNGSGNSTQNTYYDFSDFDPLNGTSYYRLAQHDADGSVYYTNIASITRDKSEYVVMLYPNPVEDEFNLLVSFPSDVFVHVTIINQLGEVVYSNEYFESNNIHKLGSNLSAGSYQVKIAGEAGEKVVKFVKK